MELELERFLENQTEMLGNLTITDSICIDTLRDICERYCELKKLRVTDVISSPIELEPVLAEIEHINELGLSKWYEVVYFDVNWQCYAGSKTFKDGEKVIKWKYCKDCL